MVTKPAVDWDQLAAFLSDEGAPGVPQSIRAGDDESAAIAEAAARICYMSYGRGRRDIADFIENLLRSKDGSVFEHINYGFAFTGVFVLPQPRRDVLRRTYDTWGAQAQDIISRLTVDLLAVRESGLGQPVGAVVWALHIVVIDSLRQMRSLL